MVGWWGGAGRSPVCVRARVCVAVWGVAVCVSVWQCVSGCCAGADAGAYATYPQPNKPRHEGHSNRGYSPPVHALDQIRSDQIGLSLSSLPTLLVLAR